MSVGLCCLLSCTTHLNAADVSTHDASTAEARDAKTSTILTHVVKVVEGIINIIKVIKDSRHDKHDIKLQAESELAQAVANIKNIADVSLFHEEISRESVEELCSTLREVATTIQPLLREYIKEDVASVHDYLQSAPLQELEQQLQALNNENQDIAIAISDEHEKEFHTNVIQALHSLVQSLFSIIQAPENPKIIGQNIADMLSNIINVASQTLKYEYLSSQDAEENVAIYLESFSNELTKEIKHLMLQTALHLRGCKQIRKCNNGCNSGCCGSSCSTVCRPCCNPCNTCSLNMQEEDNLLRKGSCCSSCSCSPACNSTCSTCNSSCCSRSQQEVKEDTVTRACPSCGCGNCAGGCCSYGTKKPVTHKEIIRRGIIRNNKRRSCTTCNSCGKNCNTCGCKKKIAEVQQEEQTKCNCGAKPKPQQTASRSEGLADQTKCNCGAKPKPRPNNVPRNNTRKLIYPESYNG